jgi:3-hydroxyisobutyrate dehydrogenase-like beta-hydroxyacid dehydrogenase
LLTRQHGRVWTWNRTAKPFPCFLGSPAEVAQRARVLLVFVKDGPALQATLEQAAPSLHPGHLVISHVTCLPSETKAAQALVAGRGARFLEAPFTGSRDTAAAGELVYYVGGEEKVMEEARPWLEPTAREIMHLGEVGAASLVKIATNMITAAQVGAAAEALALMEYSGVDGKKFLEAVARNACASPALAMKLPAMLAGDFAPRFSLANMEKDMRLALRLLEENHLPGEIIQGFLHRVEATRTIGGSEEDFSAIYRTLRPEK